MDRTSFRIQYGIEPDSISPQDRIACFRCGICCTIYQPPVSLAEARSIAAAIGLTVDAFLERYTDDSWPGRDSYLIDTYNGACIFLGCSEGSKIASCRIHQIRPQACREWLPELSRKECRQGLEQYWGLTVGVSGQLEGSDQKLQDFQEFLNSLES